MRRYKLEKFIWGNGFNATLNTSRMRVANDALRFSMNLQVWFQVEPRAKGSLPAATTLVGSNRHNGRQLSLSLMVS